MGYVSTTPGFCWRWLYLPALDAWFSCRNTSENWIQPSLSQRRRVEGLWDPTGRYHTVITHSNITVSTCHNNILTRCLSFFTQEELANSSSCPHMCAYKLVTVEAKFFMVGGKVETTIQKVQRGYSRFSKRAGTFWIHVAL